MLAGQLAVAVATPPAVAGILTGTSAEAQVKKGCPNKVAAACKKTFKRVCSQTDKNGSCTGRDGVHHTRQ
jgi:hypothetical protein